MHHYAAALITVTALPVALILAHEYTEHRKRKAEARRAAERQAEAERAAYRAQLDAINHDYHDKTR